MPKSLLIVDDNPDIRRLLRSFFEDDPRLQVCGEAVDGLDAIEKAHALRPDLVILDLSMPRMNGLEAARELRVRLPAIPIILCTMYADSLVASDAQAAGISAVFSKEEITRLIRYVGNTLHPVANALSPAPFGPEFS